MTADIRSQRTTDSDGAAVDIFSLPTDEASLERLLRDLFENHWQAITFGPLIQGAAWEMRALHAPTYVGMLDDYLTVAFGASHFHLCIGPTRGPRHDPTPPALARHRQTARAELYRRLDRSGAPASWGLRLFNGAGEQQLTILLQTRSSLPRETSSCRSRTGRGWHCGINCARDGPDPRNPIRTTDPGSGSHTDIRE